MPPPQFHQDQCQLLQRSKTGRPGDINRELCVFEFPGCRGCRHAMLKLTTLELDPMRSKVLDAWLHGSLHRPT